MPYKDKEKQREYTRNWRASHKQRGLCFDCNKKAVPGFLRCASHLYKANLRFIKHYQQYRQYEVAKDKEWLNRMRQENRCDRCGAPLIEDEVRYCFACKASESQKQIKGVLKYEIAN